MFYLFVLRVNNFSVMSGRKMFYGLRLFSAACHVTNFIAFWEMKTIMKCMPPLTQLLYSKSGVFRGITIFLIFDLKYRLWVLVRTASNV